MPDLLSDREPFRVATWPDFTGDITCETRRLTGWKRERRSHVPAFILAEFSRFKKADNDDEKHGNKENSE